MTPKQRAKIYRKAAKWLFNNSEPCCCWAIKNSYEELERTAGTLQIMDAFPEFAAFNPTGHKIGHWWGIPWLENEGKEPRLLALLLAAEIAKDSKE